MKILIVKKKDSCWPFVEEQVRALCASDSVKCMVESGMLRDKREEIKDNRDGLEVEWHLIEGRGMMGYMRDVMNLLRDIRKVNPDVIHAHYGMSGYYACLVTRLMFWRKRVPIVVTYHGSDINQPKVRKISQRATRMADYNIFVSPKLRELVEHGENSQVLPCGLNMEDWEPIDKKTAREKMGLSAEKRYVLFSSDFQTEVKNPELAKQAVALFNDEMSRDKSLNEPLALNDIQLIELKGYTREQVNALMHGVDVCLMTSFTEGSPQFIKEAMVCGCPIVTTRVGDAEYVIGEMEGCYFTDYTVENCAKQLENALVFAAKHERTNGRERIMEIGYDNREIARKIWEIYEQLTDENYRENKRL